MNTKATRWALVTFALGISCVVFGMYIPDKSLAFFAALLLSFLFASFGGLSISEEKVANEHIEE